MNELTGIDGQPITRRHYALRPFRDTDAPALAELFHASVREVGAHHYTEPQTRAWSPTVLDPADYIERAKSRVVLVAIDGDDAPLGYGDLEPDGHLDHLYCRPDRVRMGVGGVLLRNLERVARSLGIERIHAEASEGAKRLLERRGYKAGPRREFTIGRVAIHNYRMSKWLNPLSGDAPADTEPPPAESGSA